MTRREFKLINKFNNKIKNHAGLARAAVLATAFVTLAALLIAVIPGVIAYQDRRARYLCAVSLERAKETVLMDYLEHPDHTFDENGALSLAGQTVLCPSGGDCYLIRDDTDDEGYSIICALHDTDSLRRLRLNAVTALSRLQNNLKLYGPDWDLKIILNGENISARRLDEIPGNMPKEGIYYLPDENQNKEIAWFCFSSGGLYAVWTPSDGWTEGAA